MMDRESRPTSLIPSSDLKGDLIDRNFSNDREMAAKVKKKLDNDVMFYESDDSMNVTVVETPKQDGSDSGVEMNIKCNRCMEMDADGAFTTSCNSSIISGHSSSPCCGDIDDLAASTSNLQISADLNNFLSPSCDGGISENGSESSSVGSSSKICRPNCINLKRTCIFGRPSSSSSSSSCRSSSANGRRLTTSPNHLEKCKNTQQQASPIPKYDTCRHKNLTAGATTCSVSPRSKNTEVRNKTVRSLSSSRCKSSQNEDKKWPLDGKTSTVKSKPPCYNSNGSGSNSANNVNGSNNNNGNVSYDSDKSNGLYATLPRHSKNRESNARPDGRSPASREPSLNRAASLRKKFVDNNLMTSSFSNGTNNPSPTVSSASKGTAAPLSNSKVSKTKIYHEVSVQTSLTNNDLNQIIAGIPTKSMTDSSMVQMEDFTQQVNNENDIEKIIDERTKIINEELKKFKTDHVKQKNVIEWLEGELASNKEEKMKYQNQLSAVTERIYSLLDWKLEDTLEYGLDELEKKVNCTNQVITSQQEEINELRDMCCIMKQDLEKSFSTQKILIESQRTTEMESLELQEFLQAEKSLLSESLKDLETELNSCREQIVKLQQEVVDKSAQCSHLVRSSEQQRQENLLLQVRLSNLEHRSKELLLQQGAAISSASVALSGLTTRFDLLLEQLKNAYNINDADLEDGIYYNDAYSCSSSSGEETNEVAIMKDSQDNAVGTGVAVAGKIIEPENCPSSRKSFMFALLNAIRNAATQSSMLKQNIAQTNLGKAADRLHTTNSSSNCCSVIDQVSGFDNPGNHSLYALKSSGQNSNDQNVTSLNGKLSKSILMINDDLTDLTKSSTKRNSLPPLTGTDEFADSSDASKTAALNVSESLNNLSEAILNRQIVEGSEENSLLKEYLKQDISLVDQVIEIDNTVTKLLKAIRVIQISFNLEEATGSGFWEDYKNYKRNDDTLLTRRRMLSISQDSSHMSDLHSEENSPLDANASPADLIFKIQHQRNVIGRVLKMLRNVRDSMVSSSELQKIQDELESVSYASCLESPLSVQE